MCSLMFRAASDLYSKTMPETHDQSQLPPEHTDTQYVLPETISQAISCSVPISGTPSPARADQFSFEALRELPLEASI